MHRKITWLPKHLSHTCLIEIKNIKESQQPITTEFSHEFLYDNRGLLNYNLGKLLQERGYYSQSDELHSLAQCTAVLLEARFARPISAESVTSKCNTFFMLS